MSGARQRGIRAAMVAELARRTCRHSAAATRAPPRAAAAAPPTASSTNTVAAAVALHPQSCADHFRPTFKTLHYEPSQAGRFYTSRLGMQYLRLNCLEQLCCYLNETRNTPFQLIAPWIFHCRVSENWLGQTIGFQ